MSTKRRTPVVVPRRKRKGVSEEYPLGGAASGHANHSNARRDHLTALGQAARRAKQAAAFQKLRKGS